MSARIADQRLSVVILAAETAALLDVTLQSVARLGGECLVAAAGGPPQLGPYLMASEEPLRAIQCVQHPWIDDFAACRNAAMEQAQGDWLLWLEAGEIVPAATAEAVWQVVEGCRDSQRAYQIPVRGLVHAGVREQVYQLRLHPRRADLRFVGRVRERLEVGGGVGLGIETLGHPIVRSAAMGQRDMLQARAERSLRLAELAMAEQGESADLYNELGDACLTMGRIGMAARHFHQALQQAATASPEQLEAYYGLLTCLDAVGPDRHAQLSLVLSALETFPLDAQLLVALGGYLRSLDYLPTAVRAFDVAFREGQVEPRLWHLVEIRELAAACGASTYLAMNRPDSALHLLEAAWRLSPSSGLLPRELAATYRRLGRLGEAERMESMLREELVDAVLDHPDGGAPAAARVRVDPPGEVPLSVRPAAAEVVERRSLARPDC